MGPNDDGADDQPIADMLRTIEPARRELGDGEAAADPEAKQIVREARKACTARCERLCTRVMALHGRVAERKGEAAAAHKVN